MPVPQQYDSAPASISEYLSDVNSMLDRVSKRDIEAIVNALLHSQREGRTIFIFGNGGSAALASHICCDLGKGTAPFVQSRMRVIALTDNVPLITAWANDAHYDCVFAEQLANLASRGDLAFAISGSGNSPNVLNGLRMAKERRCITVGLTGFQGGKMKSFCDLCVVVPSNNMQVIEDAHSVIGHGIFTVLCARLKSASLESTIALQTAD